MPLSPMQFRNFLQSTHSVANPMLGAEREMSRDSSRFPLVAYSSTEETQEPDLQSLSVQSFLCLLIGSPSPPYGEF